MIWKMIMHMGRIQAKRGLQAAGKCNSFHTVNRYTWVLGQAGAASVKFCNLYPNQCLATLT